MKHYSDIIIAPVITEKSASLGQNKGQYVFKVDSRASKTEIKYKATKLNKEIIVDFPL